MAGRLGLWLLCAVLAIWYPLNFSAELAKTLPSLGLRGPIAALELLAHGVVAATCVAAAWALLNRSPHGPRLARLALVSAALAAVQSLYGSVLPTQIIPGDELPLAAFAVAHSGFWLIYLSRSADVQVIEGTD